MLTHAAYTTGKYTHGYVGLVYSRTEIGVAIFFVLSGFVVRPVGQGRRLGRRSTVGAPLRLAPGAPHHAGLHRHRARGVCRLPLPHRRTEPRSHLDGVVPQPDAVADVHRQLPVFVSAPRPHTWSLAVEVAFYVVLPLLAYLLLVVLCRRRWRPVLLLTGLSGLALITPAWLILVHTTDFLPDGAGLWSPTYLSWFIGGMMLAVLQPMGVRAYAMACVPLVVACVASSRRRLRATRRRHRPNCVRRCPRWRSMQRSPR